MNAEKVRICVDLNHDWLLARRNAASTNGRTKKKWFGIANNADRECKQRYAELTPAEQDQYWEIITNRKEK